MRNSAGVSRCGVDCMRIRTVSEEAGGRGGSSNWPFDGLTFGRAPWAFMGQTARRTYSASASSNSAGRDKELR